MKIKCLKMLLLLVFMASPINATTCGFELTKEAFPKRSILVETTQNLLGFEKDFLTALNNPNLTTKTFEALAHNSLSFEKGYGHYFLPQADAFRNLLDAGDRSYGNSYALKYGTSSLDMCSSWNPAQGHIGNQFLKGPGSYGSDKKKDILSVYDDLCESALGATPFDEVKFGEICQTACSTGEGISKKELQDLSLKWASSKMKKALSFSNRLPFLLGNVEVVRRYNPGTKTLRNGEVIQIPEFPFATCASMIFDLWKQGELEVKDVLDKDAPYGPFTEINLSQGTKRTVLEKFIKVFGKVGDLEEKYVETLEEETLSAHCDRDPKTDEHHLNQEGVEHLLNAYYTNE